MNKKIPVIIDCDTGIDDAGALMMACASERLEILAVTTVSGNVGLEHTHPNTMNLLNLLGRPEIPVAKGADRPLVRPPMKASAVHGFNGLRGYQFAQTTTAAQVALPAAAYMAKVLEEQDEKVTIVALGPLTNVAILLLSRPDLAPKIDKIVFMGVSYQDGNPTPITTFNVLVDPEAFRICTTRGVDFYACPLDTLRSACVGASEVEKIRTFKSPVADFILKTSFAPRQFTDEEIAQINKSGNEEYINRERLELLNKSEKNALLDQATMAFVIAPELFTFKKYYCEVECAGTITTGYTFVDKRNNFQKSEEEKNLYFIETVDEQGFAKLFLDLLGSYEEG